MLSKSKFLFILFIFIGSLPTLSNQLALKQNKTKLLLEVPDSLLNQNFLLSSRVSEISAHRYMTAGYKLADPLVVYFEKSNNKLFLKQRVTQNSYNQNDATLESFKRNNLEAVYHSFKIQKSKNRNYLIDITKFIKSELAFCSPFNSKSRPGNIKNDLTTIESAKIVEGALELKVRYFYKGRKKVSSALLHKSLFPIQSNYQKRQFDPRIGYYDITQTEFANQGYPAKKQKFITRWNIQPKFEDREKHFEGELVVPQKQIVFYIDSALPKKWYPYVKKGIEAWNKAFEAIGFKQVIVTKPYENSDEFDKDNFATNCFRYSTSTIPNAMGNKTINPLTGEIVQGDIHFYQEVIKKMERWIFTQTSAADPTAWPPLSDEKIGLAIRNATAHEMGHVLGLPHNFKASYAYSIDSLRSPSFTQKYGSTPSIMDYARYNYIAQPEDKVRYFAPPLLGEYDLFSIKWGYQFLKKEVETDSLNLWAFHSHKNPALSFGKRKMGYAPDPTSQAASLGNDDLVASKLGIKNLKSSIQLLIPKLVKKGDDFVSLEYYHSLLVDQYAKNLKTASSYIAGVESNFVVEGDYLKRTLYPSSKIQLKALKFVYQNIIQAQTALLNKKILNRYNKGLDYVEKMQIEAFKFLINKNLFIALIDNHKHHSNSLTFENYCNRLEDLILTNFKKSSFSEYALLAYIQTLNNLNKSVEVKDCNTAKLKSGLVNLKRLFAKKIAKYKKTIQHLAVLELLNN